MTGTAFVNEIRCTDITSTQISCKLIRDGHVRLEGIVEHGEIPSVRTTKWNNTHKEWVFGIDDSECKISGTTLVCRKV